jgi:hypothetical protein
MVVVSITRPIPRMRLNTGAHHAGASTSTIGASYGSRQSAISGSDRIASPIHAGATIRIRSIARSASTAGRPDAA